MSAGRGGPNVPEHLAVAVLALTTAAIPLAWGGFRPSAYLGLIVGWGVGAALWMLGLVLAGRRPAWSGPLGVVVAALVALAWWGALRDLPVATDSFTERHLARVAERWPESFQRRSPLLTAAAVTTGLAAFLAVVDLGRRRRWRRVLGGAVLVGAVATAVVGLVQIRLGVTTIYGEGVRLPGRVLGPFFHHTAAGAQLNLGLPLALALVLGLWWRRTSPTAGTWLLGVGAGLGLVALLAAHAANIARFPPVAGLLGMAVTVLLAWWLGRREAAGAPSLRWRRPRWLAVALAGGIIVAGLWLVRETNQWETARERWGHLLQRPDPSAKPRRAPPPVSEWERRLRADYLIPSDFRDVPLGDRGAAYGTAVRAIAARPLLGWGPGGWPIAAAAHTDEPYLRTFFLYLQFVHQDFLQAAVVWGLPGALAWLALALGGWVARLRPGDRQPWDAVGRDRMNLGAPSRDQLATADADRARAAVGPADRLWEAGLFGALLAVALQSLVDFPLQIPSVMAGFLILAALGWSRRRAPG